MTHPNDTIPEGFCQCGCGEKTAIATSNWPTAGHIKGKPKRYLKGHNAKRDAKTYWVEEDRGYATPCWIWQGTISSAGYPQRWDSVLKKPVNLHRRAAEDRFGPLPFHVKVDHLCRQPSCINPDHLEPVTNAINVQRGKTAKLTPAIVRQIRAMAPTMSAYKIARHFGIGVMTTYVVIKRESWQNVE